MEMVSCKKLPFGLAQGQWKTSLPSLWAVAPAPGQDSLTNSVPAYARGANMRAQMDGFVRSDF